MDIDARLSEIDSLADGPRKELETSILRWHIDTLLRIELSKKNGDAEKIWDVCRRHGFIPQPEISRSEPIDPRKVEISEFGKVVLTENSDNMLSIIRTSDMHVWTSVRCPGKHFLSRRGRYLHGKLEDLVAKHPDKAVEARGMGFMQGLDLKIPPKDVISKCMEKGLLVCSAGYTVLRFVPPLIATEDDIDRAISIVDAALSEL